MVNWSILFTQGSRSTNQQWMKSSRRIEVSRSSTLIQRRKNQDDWNGRVVGSFKLFTTLSSSSSFPKFDQPTRVLSRGSRVTERSTSFSTDSIAIDHHRPSTNLSKTTGQAQEKVSYQYDDQALLVDFGKGCRSKFDHIWLRDNCRCEQCFHPHTKQHLLNTFEIPLDIKPTRVELLEEGFLLTWPNRHRSLIKLSFLLKHSYDPPIDLGRQESGQERKKIHFWDHTIINCMPSVSYKDIFSLDQITWNGDFYVLDWLRKIQKFGFCLVDDVPVSPEATEALLRRIAFIRETHYGAFWDFTADMEHGDTAYTNLALGAHTDTTYFSDPAGLQLFHLLSPPTSHEGGKSLLVDGFAAAKILKREHPEAYQILSDVPIDTHASGGLGVAFRPILPQPVFSHHPDTRELTVIRWNPEDRQPLRGRVGVQVKHVYQAMREWEKIIKSSQMELWKQMKMGQALIFDNHRVLHGRSAFTGSRRLCGGYINGDDYRSRLKSLEQRLLAVSAEPEAPH